MMRETLGRVGGAAGVVLVAATFGGAAVASAQTAPTFTRDVAPILQKKCEACHRPDSIAPMSLVTYQQTRPWARSIKARVTEHSMPPFQIDRTVGVTKFKNDESLTPAELDTVVKWVDAGRATGRLEGHAAASGVARRRDLELRQDLRPGRARSHHQLASVHDAGHGTGRLGRAGDRVGHYRTALGAGHRDSPERHQGTQDHAPRHRLSRSRTIPAPRAACCRCRSWNGPSASRAS